VRAIERGISTGLAGSEHQVVSDDAAGHAAGDEKREPAEHSPLGDIWDLPQGVADALGELVVERHQWLISAGRPNRPNSSSWRGKPVIPAIRSPSIANTITP
jgi:hypothetical protein